MFTHHAQARMQQRAIPDAAIEALLAFGTPHRRGHADVYCLDRRGRARAAEAMGWAGYRRIEKALDAYVVMGDDGCVITAAHRCRRMQF